jgi:hypothetical protein
MEGMVIFYATCPLIFFGKNACFSPLMCFDIPEILCCAASARRNTLYLHCYESALSLPGDKALDQPVALSAPSATSAAPRQKSDAEKTG